MIRTDLALEATLNLGGKLPKGITLEEKQSGKLKISTVEVSSPMAALRIEKPMGIYITVEAPPFSSTTTVSDEETECIANELRKMLPDEGMVLVVGLGNQHITPDAIGPRAVDQMIATRHISGPKAEGGFEGFRPVSAIAPGVLGQTGIETEEIIASIVKDIEPVAVIVIDALASRSVQRLGSTLQISDNGISPGSGIQNSRKELSRETLGIPVISMGVPTVVDATTLAYDLLAGPEEDVEQFRQMFEPKGSQMMVTPRDVDLMVERAAKLISFSVNRALQPNLTLEDISYLVS